MMNRPLHVCTVREFYLYGRRRVQDLRSAGAGSDRVGRAISLSIPGPEKGSATCRTHKEAHKGAHNHLEDRAQREVDRHQLRRHGHTRFRVSLGLHGVLALGDTHYILTRGNHLGNTDYRP